MGRFTTAAAAICAAVTLSAGAAGAQGVLPDRMTFVTIDAPVSLPGVVLPAGEYMFRLADTQANRNVVQIFDKERTRIFATLIAVSADRPKSEISDEAVITFRETPSDHPPALRYWYYAGERSGQEFVYPKEQAMKIAQASGEPVMAVDSSSNDIESMKKGDISRIDGAAANAQPTSSAAGETASAAREASPAPTRDSVAAPESAAARTESSDMNRAQAAATEPGQMDRTTGSHPMVTPPHPAARERADAQAPAGTSGSSSADARPTGTSGRDDVDTAQGSARELPRTAGNSMTAAVLGFIALGAALGVRLMRRHVIV